MSKAKNQRIKQRRKENKKKKEMSRDRQEHLKKIVMAKKNKALLNFALGSDSKQKEDEGKMLGKFKKLLKLRN